MVYSLVLIALLSGLFGRMGGAGKAGSWYDFLLDTKWRDIGCSAIVVLASIILWGWQPSLWWAYVLTFLLHWGAFATYWKDLFGKITMWFSGLVVGIAGLPLMFLAGDFWWILPVRALVLMVVWECLNRYLPEKVLIWRRDVAEEFLRYTASL